MVDGEVHHFAARGLYNGLVLLGDEETGSLWDHVTGKCVYGPLEGRQLATFPLKHMTVEHALMAYPDAEFALSKQTFKQSLMSTIMNRGRRSKRGVLPPTFQKTMGEEDLRRPRMEMGLGVWTDNTRRYYPMSTLQAADGALIDVLDGLNLLVYIDPSSFVPAAIFTTATQCHWSGEILHLDTGEKVEGGRLFGVDGIARTEQQPMQLFTRWYGFAYTFPGCDIFKREA